MNTVIIIGAGNMGLAMGEGLLRNPNIVVYFKTQPNFIPDKTKFTDTIQQKRVFFNDDTHFFTTLKNPWIILAVKPHLINSVLLENNLILSKTNPKAIISVAAGIDIKTIKATSPTDIPIIRTMPNIAVSTGNGIIGYFSDDNAIYSDFTALCHVFGMTYKLESEEEFHLFTALSGSGPAFLFHTIEAMAHAASRLGMDYTDAEKIATRVFMGASGLLDKQTPTALRQSVTSPNGTTQAGLNALMNPSLSPETSHLTELFYKTLDTAKKRSQNML
jgi:pyrroline-5-carboxylate reductase